MNIILDEHTILEIAANQIRLVENGVPFIWYTFADDLVPHVTDTKSITSTLGRFDYIDAAGFHRCYVEINNDKSLSLAQ